MVLIHSCSIWTSPGHVVLYKSRCSALALNALECSGTAEFVGLPADSVQLLQTFALRYGVGRVFEKLMIVHIAAKCFQYIPVSLELLLELWLDLRETVAVAGLCVTLEEKRMLKETKALLNGGITTMCTNYDYLRSTKKRKKILALASEVCTGEGEVRVLLKCVVESAQDKYAAVTAARASEMQTASGFVTFVDEVSCT